LNRRTVQSGESKKKEVGCLQRLRNTELTVEGRERRKVDVGSVVILETYEPGVFDAVPLRGESLGK
jgi:hypothetical protein